MRPRHVLCLHLGPTALDPLVDGSLYGPEQFPAARAPCGPSGRASEQGRQGVDAGRCLIRAWVRTRLRTGLGPAPAGGDQPAVGVIGDLQGDDFAGLLVLHARPQVPGVKGQVRDPVVLAVAQPRPHRIRRCQGVELVMVEGKGVLVWDGIVVHRGPPGWVGGGRHLTPESAWRAPIGGPELPSRRASGGLELHLVVDLGQGQGAADAGQGDAVGEGGVVGQGPPAVVAAAVELHLDAVLGDQQILAQAGDLAVDGELVAPVVGLGGIRQHLADQAGVEQDVAPAIMELVLAAECDQVGVLTCIGSADTDLEIVRIDVARAALHLGPQLADDIGHDGVVLDARPGHGEDLAGDVLAAPLQGRALAFQPFLEAQVGFRLQGHGASPLPGVRRL